MMASLDNLIEVSANYISDQILSPQALLDIKKTVSILPNLPNTANILFESRLGETTPSVDFSLAVSASDGAREILAEYK